LRGLTGVSRLPFVVAQQLPSIYPTPVDCTFLAPGFFGLTFSEALKDVTGESVNMTFYYGNQQYFGSRVESQASDEMIVEASNQVAAGPPNRVDYVNVPPVLESLDGRPVATFRGFPIDPAP